MNEIIRLNDENKEVWEEHLKNNQETRIQHSLSFMEAIKKTYHNCEAYYFLYEGDNKTAIFPFFLVKSNFLGNKIISLPFLDIGGFSGIYDSTILKELVGTLKKVNKNINHIEVRLNTSLENFDKTKDMLLASEFKENKNKHQFIIFPTTKEDMWKRFHKHTRNDIRKAQKSGLTIKEMNNKQELKNFYKLYLREMRNFGTPQHSYKFFENLFDILGKSFVGFNCYHDNNLAGSLIIYSYHKHAYISFNVSDQDFRNYRPNDLLYWTAINRLIDNGVKDIDMGQVEKGAEEGSHAEGLYKFKAKWLGELHERVYFRWSEQEAKPEENSKYKSFRSVWKKLPLFIIKQIGPKICSELGI